MEKSTTRFSRWLMALLCLTAITPPGVAQSYGLPANIQDGNILHCFDWPINEVKNELPNIAAAGFGSVQVSPLQRPDVKVGSPWHDLYRPYDLSFKSSSFCSESDIRSLCSEAANYGIKIIVDVVANHVDKTAGYHDPWWDSNNRVRWEGGIDYRYRNSITHGQLGDYGDVNSEHSDVIAKGKAYVEQLKSFGVKGIRWDAAKHIGLPSEGCGFWSAVTSVPGMYHYGEVLDNPGPDAGIIREYGNYMSVTDNQYSNYAARDNGGLPGGFGGAWDADYGLGKKVVYWGESHDTYSNDEWSCNRDQATIDRAYAAYACRNGATALYFSRPNAKGFNNIKVGKGSTAFKAKHIAEVNKFRNAMVGKADYFTNSGNAISVTRKDGGAVIVMKGSGNVSIANGGGYCPAGTYTDRVSGGQFTVTSTTISGIVGSSGVAVLYNGGGGGGDTPITGKQYCYFINSLGWTPYVWAWDANNGDANCNANGTWPGDAMTQKDGKYYWEAPDGKIPTHIIISNNGNEKAGGGSSAPGEGDLVFVNGATYNSDGTTSTGGGGGGGGDTPGTAPASLYILGNLAGGAGWGTTPGTGIAMTKNGDIFTASNVTFELASGETTCYFNLATTTASSWDDLNQSADRYGASVEGDALTVGQASTMTAYPLNVTASGCLSWTVAPGTYQVIADFSNMTIKVATTGASADDAFIDRASDNPIYYNMQGVRVDNPAPGFYIVVRGGHVTKEMIQ